MRKYFHADQGTMNFMFAILFVVVSYKIYYRLEEFHNEYLEENKNKIRFAAVGLSIPCVAKSIWDFM